MWQFLLKTLITEVIGAVSKMVSDYLKLQKAKKKDKKLVKAAISEKDPKKRAANIRNLLS